MDVFVAGGTGFVGESLCRRLAGRGHAVTAASRSPDDADLPAGIETATVDVTDADLTDAVAGHDAVVNLVALPSHVQPSGQSHAAVHRDGTKHLLRASEATGVERFVQMSGLGVDSGVETAYFQAKRRAERLVRASSLDWVVYRPSVVFGDGCAFLPFLQRVTLPVVTPLPATGLRIQPLWVDDLAPMLADGVTEPRHAGATYELGGPEVLTLAETVRVLRDTRIVQVPKWLASAGFALADAIPGVPLGRDQYRALSLDNTVADNDVTAFGVVEDDLSTLSEYIERKE